jgi:hypothetical protein
MHAWSSASTIRHDSSLLPPRTSKQPPEQRVVRLLSKREGRVGMHNATGNDEMCQPQRSTGPPTAGRMSKPMSTCWRWRTSSRSFPFAFACFSGLALPPSLPTICDRPAY